MTATLTAFTPMILDNYATHKHKDVAVFLAKHPRFQPHHTATSWSIVEPGREVASRAHRQGATPRRVPRRARPDLLLEKYMQVHNNEPRPLVWTAAVESVLTKSAAPESPFDQTVSR
jgi:hypothetical protein